MFCVGQKMKSGISAMCDAAHILLESGVFYRPVKDLGNGGCKTAGNPIPELRTR